MKYKTPLYSSFALSAIGLILLYFNYNIIAQAVFVSSFVFSFPAFKLRAGIESGIAHLIPAFILSWFYFNPHVFPILSIAIFIAAMQNPFLELFFPSRMYNNTSFKIIAAVISLSSYIAANIIYPSGWQLWVFPGIILLVATILTVMVTMDLIMLKKTAIKGYITAGSVCPDFSLPDETGELISLKDFKGKFLMLVFVRGDWCPGCHITLRTYQRHKEKFMERGVHLLSIGPDPLGVNKEMVEKLGLSYHLLSDDKQEVAKQFCVELQNIGLGIPQYDFVPLPASFLIDKEGVVRYTSRADKAGEILNPSRVFDVLDSLK